tara:strand:- start:1804 stop:2217 length:414 start_codon:yes stop_codon:yes gene_type:complete
MAMMGTEENKVEQGVVMTDGFMSDGSAQFIWRYKLPHGWMLSVRNGGGFVPFAEDGTGWGKNDPARLAHQLNVVLTNCGIRKIEVIKAVIELTGAGLKEAKTMVESAPITIKAAASKEEAVTAKAVLVAAGAHVELG